MIIAMIVFSITPGLGGIIGSGDTQRAARVRGEIMSMSWLLTTAICTTVLLWNRCFLGAIGRRPALSRDSGDTAHRAGNHSIHPHPQRRQHHRPHSQTSRESHPRLGLDNFGHSRGLKSW